MAFRHFLFQILLLTCIHLRSTCATNLAPTCESPIYCYGELLHTVQMAGIFTDSKTLIDMSMLDDEQRILADFNKLLKDNDFNVTKIQILDFVHTKFTSANDLEVWIPLDYNPNPTFLQRIEDPLLADFAKTLISIWPQLSRKVSASVRAHPDRHSLIPLPHGVIVPGGRFREAYYWDTYWIIKGLLVSEMYDTVRGLLNNFVYLIQRYGFIPNGGRVYYTRRSQPPLFSSMCMEYFQVTGDIQWVRDNIVYMEKELLYWLMYRTIKVNGKYRMAHYLPKSKGPRPESYKEDYTLGKRFPPKKRQYVYNELKAAAESGWDFSSRWFYARNSLGRNLSHIQTSRTLPVDLNSILCKSFAHLAHFYSLLGEETKQHFWQHRHETLKQAIYDVFWNSSHQIWYDLDLETGQHRNMFFVSNIAPLWAGLEHEANVFNHVYDYLVKEKLFDYQGGLPTSLQHSGEQWDFPNAWAPLQDYVITALHRSPWQEHRNMAEHLSKLWITSNFIGYLDTGELFEKYDAVVPGRYGGGGEYTIQTGFGWTNGLALDLIKKFFTIR